MSPDGQYIRLKRKRFTDICHIMLIIHMFAKLQYILIQESYIAPFLTIKVVNLLTDARIEILLLVFFFVLSLSYCNILFCQSLHHMWKVSPGLKGSEPERRVEKKIDGMFTFWDQEILFSLPQFISIIPMKAWP